MPVLVDNEYEHLPIQVDGEIKIVGEDLQLDHLRKAGALLHRGTPG